MGRPGVRSPGGAMCAGALEGGRWSARAVLRAVPCLTVHRGDPMVNARRALLTSTALGLACARGPQRPPAGASPPAFTVLPSEPVPEGCTASIHVPWGERPPIDLGEVAKGVVPPPALVPAVAGGSCSLSLDADLAHVIDPPPSSFGGGWVFRVPAGYTGPVECVVGGWASPRFEVAPGARWPPGTYAGATKPDLPRPTDPPNSVSFYYCEWGWTKGLSQPAW